MSKLILDNLFHSKIRVKVLKFLFRNYPADFSIREIALRVQEAPSATRDELELLKKISIVRRK